MAYKQLLIWVEGSDDELFFNQMIKPIFVGKYDWVEVRPYAKETREYMIKFLKSILSMKADYILVTDINSAPCITGRKQRLRRMFRNLEENKTIVVIQEIESWYLAGLNKEASKELGLPYFEATDDLKKELFSRITPKHFDSKIDFLLELLKYFSLDTARQKNKSFRYFIEKYQ